MLLNALLKYMFYPIFRGFSGLFCGVWIVRHMGRKGFGGRFVVGYSKVCLVFIFHYLYYSIIYGVPKLG